MKKIYLPKDRSLSLKANNLLFRMLNQSKNMTATVAEISDWQGVSHAEAVKIASELVKKGYAIYTIYGYAVNKARLSQMDEMNPMTLKERT